MTARHRARHEAKLAEERALEERNHHITEMALRLVAIEMQRDPNSPHLAAEHAAVYVRLLQELDLELDSTTDPLSRERAVDKFRDAVGLYCRRDARRGAVALRIDRELGIAEPESD